MSIHPSMLPGFGAAMVDDKVRRAEARQAARDARRRGDGAAPAGASAPVAPRLRPRLHLRAPRHV